MATTTRGNVQAAVVKAKTKLDSILRELGGLAHDPANLFNQGATTHNVSLALSREGIVSPSDFFALDPSDVDSLQYQDTNHDLQTPLISDRRMLKQLIHFFHTLSREKGSRADVSKMTKAQFDGFRTSDYDANAPLSPWNAKAKNDLDVEVTNWKKNIKPNAKAYKDFKEEAYWLRAKEQIMGTLEAQGLEHLIDATFVVTNPDLDSMQQKWLYNVFQEIMKAPTAKTIVLSNILNKDMRVLWKELVDTLDDSVTTELKANQLSSYMTSTKLHEAGWRGTQEAWLLNWKEASRNYNEVSKVKYDDDQLTQFMNNAVAGTPNLAQTLNIYKTAQRAAGNTTPLSFAGFISLLQAPAQTHDAGREKSTNPVRAKRSVNCSDRIFEGEDPNDGTRTFYDVSVHDMDTPIDQLMAMRSDQSFPSAPRKARMNFTTWKSLTPEDQQQWDKLSDPGKTTILDYAAKRGSNANNRNNNDSDNSIMVNNHKVTFESDTKTPEKGTALQASVHLAKPGILKAASLTTGTQALRPSLLEAATSMTRMSDGLDVPHMMAQTSNACTSNVRTHEFMARSEYTPEVYVHERIANVHERSKPAWLTGIPSSSSEEADEQAVPGPDLLDDTPDVTSSATTTTLVTSDVHDITRTMERVIISMSEPQTAASCAAALVALDPGIRDLLDGVHDEDSGEDSDDDMMTFSWADIQRETLGKPLCGVYVPRPPATAPQSYGKMSGKYSEVEKPRPAKDRINATSAKGNWTLESSSDEKGPDDASVPDRSKWTLGSSSDEEDHDDAPLPDLMSSETQPASPTTARVVRFRDPEDLNTVQVMNQTAATGIPSPPRSPQVVPQTEYYGHGEFLPDQAVPISNAFGVLHDDDGLQEEEQLDVTSLAAKLEAAAYTEDVELLYTELGSSDNTISTDPTVRDSNEPTHDSSAEQPKDADAEVAWQLGEPNHVPVPIDQLKWPAHAQGPPQPERDAAPQPKQTAPLPKDIPPDTVPAGSAHSHVSSSLSGDDEFKPVEQKKSNASSWKWKGGKKKTPSKAGTATTGAGRIGTPTTGAGRTPPQPAAASTTKRSRRKNYKGKNAQDFPGAKHG